MGWIMERRCKVLNFFRVSTAPESLEIRYVPWDYRVLGVIVTLLGLIMVFLTLTHEELRLRCDGGGSQECVIEENYFLGTAHTQWLIHTTEVERFPSKDLGEASLRERKLESGSRTFRVYLKVGHAPAPFSIFSTNQLELQGLVDEINVFVHENAPGQLDVSRRSSNLEWPILLLSMLVTLGGILSGALPRSFRTRLSATDGTCSIVGRNLFKKNDEFVFPLENISGVRIDSKSARYGEVYRMVFLLGDNWYPVGPTTFSSRRKNLEKIADQIREFFQNTTREMRKDF